MLYAITESTEFAKHLFVFEPKPGHSPKARRQLIPLHCAPALKERAQSKGLVSFARFRDVIEDEQRVLLRDTSFDQELSRMSRLRNRQLVPAPVVGIHVASVEYRML